MMRKSLTMALLGVAGMAVAACGSTRQQVEYSTVATVCKTYAAALRTARDLKADGKLSAATISRIDATTGPVQAVCSGAVPNTDAAAVQKVADAVIAVLEAQK